MMKTIIHLITTFLLACALLSACKEKEEEPKPVPTYARGDRFIGSYRVTDDTGAVYTMRISKFVSAGGGQYLRIENLANMFVSINVPIDNEWVNPDSLLYNSNNLMPMPFISGIKDKLNRTWDLTPRPDDSTTAYEENYLYWNVMVLHFRLNNMPYYGIDKVPFHFAYHKHTAVKQ